MKVVDVEEIKSEIIEIDEGDWKFYKRYSADNWEVNMGESWEPCYNSEKLETAYQEYKKAN